MPPEFLNSGGIIVYTDISRPEKAGLFLSEFDDRDLRPDPYSAREAKEAKSAVNIKHPAVFFF